MIKYSKQNKNYKYILTVIDFFSKYSWCFPLKSKKSVEIINYFKDIFKNLKENQILFKVMKDLNSQVTKHKIFSKIII